MPAGECIRRCQHQEVHVIEFLLYARDVLTVIVFAAVLLLCALHDSIPFFRSLFANSECPSEKPVEAKKKFIVSAATYVR